MDKTVEEKVRELKAKNPLSDKIKDDYRLEGLIPGEIAWKGEHYDLRAIDAKTARKLVEEGFPNLVKIDKKTSSTATSSNSKS